MHRVGDQQVHVAVEAAEEGEVGAERRDVDDGALSTLTASTLSPVDQRRGDVEAEGGEPAAVLPEVDAVDVDVGDDVGAVELQEELRARASRRRRVRCFRYQPTPR